MLCENCNQEHDGSYGSGRFCCQKCARSFSTKKKRKEINQKVSNTLKINYNNGTYKHITHYNKYNNTNQLSNIIYKCQYCGITYKKLTSIKIHENSCKMNPEVINNKLIYDKTHPYILRDGTVLDKSIYEINTYIKNNIRCEICNKTIEESIHSTKKCTPKRLCIDHDHLSNTFRGVLCQRCNSFLGWYETYIDNINSYLNK